ncbi:MAG: zinc ribbon domain-containing protein, partial [Candidatus Eremiobacterota bacterium]
MENNKKCPNCGQSGNIDRNLFCHSCNTQLRLDPETGGYASALLKCPECGQLNNPSVTFCSKCGCSIKETSLVTVIPAEKKKFNKLYASFVAVGIALLLGIGITWTYFNLQPAQQGNPKIDVVFCIDTTGSMGDEIEVIKEELKNMIGSIQDGNPRPYVRVGVVAYKDRGDVYVVQPYELTGDIQSVESVINSLSASGGSDHE